MADEYRPPDGFVPITNDKGEIVSWGAPAQSYGGGGGYGVSSAPSDTDKKAAKLLSSIVNENAEIIKDTYTAQMRLYDISDEMSKNLAIKKTCQARRKAGQEWYTSQQRIQAATAQLADVAGGALRSSLMHDFVEIISRADDQADTEALKTMRENLQDVEINLAEAIMATINSRNDLAVNGEQQLRQMFTDWLSQLINIHPDLLSSADFAPTGSVIIDLSHDVPAQANTPSWINYEQWFEERVKAAIKPEDAPRSRPDKAAQMAWLAGYLKMELEVEAASRPEYWAELRRQSERKTQ